MAASGCGGSVDVACGGGSGESGLLWFLVVAVLGCGSGGNSGCLWWFLLVVQVEMLVTLVELPTIFVGCTSGGIDGSGTDGDGGDATMVVLWCW